MSRRLRGPRATLAGALAATAVAACLLAVPAGAGHAEETESVFHPQLVKVSTPLRADRTVAPGARPGPDRARRSRLRRGGPARAGRAGRSSRARASSYDVVIPDLVARGVEIAELNEEYAASVARSPLPSGRTGYRTLDDYNADMTKLQQRNRELVKKFALKRPSLDGRTIYGVEIGQGVRRPNAGAPTFVLMGAHHAREWPSAELAMEFAFDLANNYGKSARITRLLKQARVIVVPVVNVDGFVLSRTDGEYSDLRELNENDPTGGTGSVAATPGRTYMRKNCRVVDGQDTPDGTCAAVLASSGRLRHRRRPEPQLRRLLGRPGAAETEPDANDVEGGAATRRTAVPRRSPSRRRRTSATWSPAARSRC